MYSIYIYTLIERIIVKIGNEINELKRYIQEERRKWTVKRLFLIFLKKKYIVWFSKCTKIS